MTTTQDALADDVLLSLVPGVGPQLRRALLAHFGSAAAALAAAPSALRDVQGIGPKLSQAIARARDTIDVTAELALARRENIGILTEASEAYPRLLREIFNPPAVLYVRGSLAPADGLAVAVVGSRHATHYGLAQAERLAGSLARSGLTVVSGLARGIDAAAHRGALAAGGRTVAVLGSGVLNTYPPEHDALAADVAQQGAVISEAPLRAAPLSGSFPQRNRIISGMSLGVIVVEAAISSGALITARHAMEQGREVFAVPGRIDNRMARGCHRLIRDGAKLVETVDDVLEELGPLVGKTAVADGRAVHHPAELLLSPQEQQVLDAVASDATGIDSVVAECGLPIHQVLATISVLEMRHLVRRVSGSQVLRL
ncbi:MAG TPA: DNA-processing protein DprA [Pirellulales bacterium]|jgi:DNA processing protein|nr:DNA-processing protein DprA [Pirellulales bacterium]